jgi:GAF domain-containing protein
VAGPDGYLTDFITTGLSQEERERLGDLPRGHGLLGVLIRLGEPLRAPNISRDPCRVGFPPHHPPMTSLLGVPIRIRNEVVGDLYLTDKIGAPEFSEDDPLTPASPSRTPGSMPRSAS